MATVEDQSLEEALKRISESPEMGTKFTHHPSECVNSKLIPLDTNKKILRHNRNNLEVINYYHIYCKLCQHHYYSCSKLNDINSFFQIHINSVDHIWNRGRSDWDEHKPIFVWEKWLCTGYCAICNKSGIEAFFVDTEFDILMIIRKHIERSHRHQQRYDIVWKKPIVPIMAKSDLFSKIYIDKLCNGQYYCSVCCLGIKQEALLEKHLYSEQHCKNFCQLIKKELNVDINNQEVKLDLEELVNQIKGIPVFSKSAMITVKKVHNIYKDHYATSELEFLRDPDMGFSPSLIENSHSVIDENLRQVTHCALCQEYPANMDRHLVSNSHQLRVMVFNRCSSVRPISLFEYLYNCCSTPIKLKEVEKYRKYKLLLQKQGLDFGIPFKPEYVDISLNFDKSECESKELENGRIEVEDVTVMDTDNRENSQPRLPKTNGTNRTVVEERKKKKKNSKPDDDVGKSKDVKRKGVDNKIKAEKLSEDDISVVQSFMKELLEKMDVIHVKGKLSCLNPDVVEEEDGNCHESAADPYYLLLQHYKDPDFVLTFEKWSFLNVSCFVCIACAKVLEKLEFVCGHMKKIKHLRHYKRLKGGKLKPVSPLGYSMNIEEGICICDKCSTRVNKMLINMHSIQNYKKVLNEICLHEKKCLAVKATLYGSSVDEISTEALSTELNKVLEIGEKLTTSEKIVDSARVDNVVGEKTCKTDGEDAQKSLPNVSTTVKEVENGLGNAEKRKVGRTKENAAKFKGKREESKASQDRNIIRIRKNLDDYLEHCNEELTGFLCAICLENGSMSVCRDHIQSENHIMNNKYILSKWNVNFGFCKYCKLLLLGTSDMFRQHYNSTYHVDKESSLTGREIVLQPLTPKVCYVLIVIGMPDMKKEDKTTCIKLILGPFGSISKIRVKKSFIEVQFVDQRVISDILALKKIIIGYKQVLTFSVKTVKQEVEIAMESNAISVLAHESKVKLFVSYLVREANNMLFSVAERQKEETLCDALRRDAWCVYQNCKCFKFGSRVTGLTVGECDLDIFLSYGDSYYGKHQNPENQDKMMKNVFAALSASQQFSHVTCIKHCRVPIVTCIHKSTNIRCDISFKNGLSCENTKLIKFMIGLDDRVKGVILFLKYWTKSNDLHGRPYFSSYALTMLVFFYLQQEPNPVLPTVEFLKSCYGEPEKVIGEWDCGFTTNQELVPKTKNSNSIIQLILGFYNFCINFDFSENVISPLTGKPLSREIIQNMVKDGLPKPYDKYQAKINPKNYREKESICLMDPFDLNHNLTKLFPKKCFDKFLYLCRISANLLSNSLQSKHFLHLQGKSPI